MNSCEPEQRAETTTEDETDRIIDTLAAFARESRRLVGVFVAERAQWNTEATADAIRHFAWGISDDNPLWVDPDYAAVGPYARLAAPPSFLFSVLYPFLHGAVPSFPLTFLISDIECSWHLPILEGDKLTAIAVHKEVIEVLDRAGRDTVHIIAETTYRNQDNEIVGTIEGTIAAIELSESEMLLEREISAYSAEDIEALGVALQAEQRTGGEPTPHLGVQPGDELPPIVRGPLTMGDLINWQAAIGPSYRAGALAYRDLLEKPHTATVLPRVGWPVRYSQQHEDFTLSRQRGMPAPFDNGAMRTAWLSVLLTNWMGDGGFLQRLRISTVRPVIYGDTNWYTGKVLRTLQGEEEILLTIRLSGTNQLGEVTTTGEAEVALPRRLTRLAHQTNRSTRGVEIEWGRRDLFASPVTVCDLFARQVQSKPEAVAVVGDTQTLTYSALNARAEALSSMFAARGIIPGSRLGLYLDRTPDTIVAVLACAKAGIAYVPLDPGYPAEQLGQMVEEAALDFVLTEKSQLVTNGGRCPEQLSLKSLMTSEFGEFSEGPERRPSVDSPAYVLFTSGSTGRSKAVAVGHGSLGLYLCSIIDALGITDSDVYMHTASFSFSASVRQLWLPLCIGAKLVLVNDETRHRPLALFESIRRERVTVWDTVPSILAFTIGSLQEMDKSQRSLLLDNQLHWIFTTGEPLPWDTVRAWKKLTGNRGSIVNLYSQTETTGTVCLYPVQDADAGSKGFVPLGRPIAHMGLCLLDEQSQSVDNGAVGEICVAGERLASPNGTRSDLSTEKYDHIGLSDGSTVWVFHTGDLGRRGSDGILEFVGRTDDQVKIRGMRVHLASVEAALSRDPCVAHCAVVAAAESNSPVDSSLIAYVVPSEGLPIDRDELRARITRWLPGFMQPRAIVVLDALPRTPNGKLDRFALPVPGSEVLGKQSSPVAPSNATEAMLSAIWCELLRLEEVSVNDNFFELGGHSLLATRIINRVRSKTHIELPILDFFNHPTIAELAVLILEKQQRFTVSN